MTTADDILGRKSGEAPIPGLCAGSFRQVVVDYERGESSQKKTPYVRFVCKVRSAEEDVKAEDLKALGDLSLKSTNHDFYLTDNALFMLDRFLGDTLGLKLGRPYRELVPEAVGKEFIAHYSGEEIVRDGKPTGQYRYERADSYAPVKGK